MKITKKPSKVPGVEYEVQAIRGDRYLTVRHALSGKVIYSPRQPAARVTDLIKLADHALKDVRWNVPADKINEKKARAAVAKMEACTTTGDTWYKPHPVQVKPACRAEAGIPEPPSDEERWARAAKAAATRRAKRGW